VDEPALYALILMVHSPVPGGAAPRRLDTKRMSTNLKLSRIVTAGATLALIAGSSLFAAGAANAADSYVTASQFGAEGGASYPAGWFVGAGSATTPVSGVSGLSLTGKIQILNGTPGAMPAGGLDELATNATLGVVSGNADFQIALYTDGTNSTGFTTLRPDNFNQAGLNPLAGWTTSGTFGTFAAGSSHTLPQYDAELATLTTTTPKLLAYGAFVPTGESATLSSITFNGNTSWFTPRSTATATPSTITVTAIGTTGVNVVLTGFVPNETVHQTFATTGMGGPTATTYTADASGHVSYTYKAAAMAPGTYYLGAAGDTSGVVVYTTVTVVADGSTPPVAAPAAPVAHNASFTG
jgi:hypothetical protein